MKGVKRPRISERQEQAAIVKVLRLLGGQVYVIGTTRRKGDYQGTNQTPGIPDLMAFLPTQGQTGVWRFLFVEVKAAGGRLRPEQQAFKEHCECTICGIDHLVGNVAVVLDWLTAQGYLR